MTNQREGAMANTTHTEWLYGLVVDYVARGTLVSIEHSALNKEFILQFGVARLYVHTHLVVDRNEAVVRHEFERRGYRRSQVRQEPNEGKEPQEPPPLACAWCNKTECQIECPNCSDYLQCLAERIGRGAIDCEEERASVVRWCDAQWEQVPSRCSDCSAVLSVSIKAVVFRMQTGKLLCGYCYHSTAGGEQTRQRDDYVTAAAMRNADAHPIEHAAHLRLKAIDARRLPAPSRSQRELAKPHPWEAWSTAGAES